MHLFYNLKVLRNSAFYLVILFLANNAWCQGDTTVLPYSTFREHAVIYVDEGFSSAPFSIHYPYTDQIDVLKYKNNFRITMGIGFSYRWISLRIGFPLPGNIRDTSQYGQTTAFTFGTDFTLGKMFWDIDLRNYTGYSIKDALLWDPTLSENNPNKIKPVINVFNLAINSWYFHDKNFRMSALRGKTAHYLKPVRTWYIKNSLNILGLNNGSYSIIPEELTDQTNSKTTTNQLSALDMSFIPGYAYVNRLKNWQFSVISGLGFAIQTKAYNTENVTRTVIGIAPRYDIGLIFGYSVPRYFAFISAEFDNKSIRFNELIYRQQFYSIRISTGIRLETKDRQNKLFKRFP